MMMMDSYELKEHATRTTRANEETGSQVPRLNNNNNNMSSSTNQQSPQDRMTPSDYSAAAAAVRPPLAAPRRASWDKEAGAGAGGGESEAELPSPATSTMMMMPPGATKDYSDLEVVSVIPASYGDAREKVAVVVDTREKGTSLESGHHHHHHLRHGTVGGAMLSPSLADPVPAYPVSMRSSTGLTGTPLTSKAGDYAEWEQRNAQMAAAQKRTFFGINYRSLSFMALAAVAFILILLATVLGITLTMKINNAHHASSSSSSSSAAAGADADAGSPRVLANSRLGAMNWTDTLGTSRSVVFYQDSYNSIMVSILDSVSNEWSQSNITQSIMNVTGASKVDVLSGTPFAAVTNRYQVSLYYLTNNNELAETYASDIVSGVWFAGSLESSLSPRAGKGSSLAAYWQICANCTGSLCVAYQQPDGRVQLANMTNNNWAFAGPVADGTTVVNATGLSLQPFTEGNGKGIGGSDAQALKLFAFESSGLLDFENGPASNRTWDQESASSAFQTTLESDPRPELATITYGAHGLTNCLVNYLTPSGAVMSYVYNGASWASGQPILSGGGSTTANFSAVATAQNMRVYGLTNGSIYEYEVDSTNPLKWTKTMAVVGA